MNYKSHIHVLRVQMLSMSRVTQRALDSSIKGYELRNLEFCRDVSRAEGEIREHHRQIRYLAHKLAALGTGGGADSRFAVAALRMGGTLAAIYEAAARMARDTMLMVESDEPPTCDEPLINLGKLVNTLVRLCVMALFEKEARHAEMVARSQGVWRRCELIFEELNGSEGQMHREDIYALRIAESLGVAARRAHELADAILFWLKARNSLAALEEYGQNALSSLLACRQMGGGEGQERQAVACSPA